MRTLDITQLLTSLATSTGHGHLAVQCEPGTDLEGIAAVLPADAIAAATASGLAVIACDDFVEGALAYCDVERRMSLVPGGTVTLVQPDGSVRRRSEVREAVVVDVDFAPRGQALPKAA